jgi:hypothetical protein
MMPTQRIDLGDEPRKSVKAKFGFTSEVADRNDAKRPGERGSVPSQETSVSDQRHCGCATAAVELGSGVHGIAVAARF